MYKISYRYLKPLLSYWGLKRWKSDTRTHAPSWKWNIYAKYTTSWHENIFRGPWNNICQIYFGEYISENMYKIYSNYTTFCENIFHIFWHIYFSMWAYTHTRTNSSTFFSRKHTRREFLREILYKNIAIIAIQQSKIHFVDIFGDFSGTV